MAHVRALTAFGLAMALSVSLAQAGDTVATGSFAGASGHSTSGTVEIVQDGDDYRVVLGQDFEFDGAPDPKLALGRDGYDASTIFSNLNANSGSQTYALPSGLNPSAYNEVWVWCEKYDVPLGQAKLK